MVLYFKTTYRCYLILGERGLDLRGSLQLIGDSNKGNFLGLIELLSHWYPIPKERALKIEGLQKKDERLYVHYLSNESQNKFMVGYCNFFVQHIFGERLSTKCYVIIIVSTPDSSNVKQTIFLLRNLVPH